MEILYKVVVPVVNWVLTWASPLSYWVACIGGGGSYMLFIATKDKKYVRFTIASIIIYTMIVAGLSVTNGGDGI